MKRIDSAPAACSRAKDVDAMHDVVAIGCGPFNLGLAALASRIEGLDLAAFEARPELLWHPGLMFDDAMFQLSFLADLVTLVDPTHPLSFLAYLRDVDRLYPFFIREEFHPTRREYEDYLRWVVSKLSVLRFSHRVESVHWDDGRSRFAVQVARTNGDRVCVLAKDLVIGIGTEPALPEALAGIPQPKLLHSADYLNRRLDVERAQHVTVIGSGQSAAEIVLDLLRRNLEGGPAFTWVTRTRSFAPLDYSKLVLEMTTPAYIRYFHNLPQDVKDRLNVEQWQHYKGISTKTLDQIHDLLYQRELKAGLASVELRCGVAVESAALRSSGDVALVCRQTDTGAVFEQATSLVVSATGYRERRPSFLGPIESLLQRDPQGRYRVRLDYSVELDESVSGKIFVANAELHSHGVATPDLGVCAYRNATILNAITGREVYRLPRRTAFTSFSVPPPALTHETSVSASQSPRSQAEPLAASFSTTALMGG
jgi:lysine N6-hydroxylase